MSRKFLFTRWLIITVFGSSCLVVLVGYPYVYFVVEPIDLASPTWLDLTGLAGGVVVVALLGCFPWFALRQMRRVLAAARFGVLRLAPLLRRERVIANDQNTGAEKITFHVPSPDGSLLEVAWQLRTHGHRLLTGADGASVLAVVPTTDPSQAILLLDSFYPLALSPAAAQQLRAALASSR
ncbi:MAG: hypothetical protein EOO73_15450 [Myxococcales bacterium]|nr:MAG: hypothetical protein EOO73_15450 [Myxococcales bacterium]